MSKWIKLPTCDGFIDLNEIAMLAYLYNPFGDDKASVRFKGASALVIMSPRDYIVVYEALTKELENDEPQADPEAAADWSADSAPALGNAAIKEPEGGWRTANYRGDGVGGP